MIIAATVMTVAGSAVPYNAFRISGGSVSDAAATPAPGPGSLG